MTPRTRRRLTICAVLSLLILTAEIVLLPVAHTPDPMQAAMAWTAGLSAEELQQASFQIDAYPAVYRRAILGSLGPEDRSAVWRVHFLKYRSSHPDLTPAQVAVIEEALEIATSDAFMPPISAEVKDQIQRTFARAVSVLGPTATRELFVSLGPTEFRLLRHFLEHPARVFSREQLLDAVWSHDSEIDARTVDVHVRRLRQAINADDSPDLIRTVRSAGYSLDSEG